ncbi:MAG: hypothetical protein ACREPD_21910 [Stenotrophomonas sp.]|uniref:hypothetical protein n=1 Tax=Gammaproteobacteria TaxID=1236 RepID=UPI003D6D172E
MNSTFLTALIAAGAALLGSAVAQFGPLLQQWLSRRHERRALLRQRYEQMATLASDLSIHMARVVETSVQAGPRSEGSELAQAATQMQTLALLYFPELKASVDELQRASIALESAFFRSSVEDAKAALEPFLQAKRAAFQAIEQHAERYARR